MRRKAGEVHFKKRPIIRAARNCQVVGNSGRLVDWGKLESEDVGMLLSDTLLVLYAQVRNVNLMAAKKECGRKECKLLSI
jgi:hypothetical protein